MQQEAKRLRLTHKGMAAKATTREKRSRTGTLGRNGDSGSGKKNKQRKVSGEKTRTRSSIVMMIVWSMKVRMLYKIVFVWEEEEGEEH